MVIGLWFTKYIRNMLIGMASESLWLNNLIPLELMRCFSGSDT